MGDLKGVKETGRQVRERRAFRAEKGKVPRCGGFEDRQGAW